MTRFMEQRESRLLGMVGMALSPRYSGCLSHIDVLGEGLTKDNPNKVYDELAMPEFSATLLGLLGISAGISIEFELPETKAA